MEISSKQVMSAIRKIESTAGKNDKVDLVRSYSKFDLFKRCLVAALDPSVTYGIAKLPSIEGLAPGDNQFSNIDVWGLLDSLASRQVTGNEARDKVKNMMAFLDADSSELFQKILLKDLRAGFGSSTVNKAIPGLVVTFDCMLADKYFKHSHKVKLPVYVEPKLDGVRVLAFVDTVKRSVNYFSRTGKPWGGFDHLSQPILESVDKMHLSMQLNDIDDVEDKIVLDSEVVTGSFNKTVSETRKKGVAAKDAVIHVFDIISQEAFRESDKKGNDKYGDYCSRRLTVELFNDASSDFDCIKITNSKLVDTEEKILSIYEHYRSIGLEGVIVKNPTGLYSRRRSKDWLKIKAEESVDLPIVSVVEGTGKYVGMLGAAIVNFNEEEVSVGSGWSDAERVSVWARKESVSGELIEVGYHEITPDGSLRHPVFNKFRPDKPVEDGPGV